MTLEEEYENQQSWRTSNDKLTFIVCAPQPDTTDHVLAGQADSGDKTRGDINFFLYPYDTVDDSVTDPNVLVGEVDIMIAATEHRGRGTGQAAVRALLVYIQRNLSAILKEYGGSDGCELRGLMVKLKEGNHASRALFERLGFQQKGEVNYFGEVTLMMSWDEITCKKWWNEASEDFKEVAYLQDSTL
jgi:methionyl-tRNA synthetase